jgi:hypothetical protein
VRAAKTPRPWIFDRRTTYGVPLPFAFWMEWPLSFPPRPFDFACFFRAIASRPA